MSSRSENFPYTDRQRRWWFATHKDQDAKIAHEAKQREEYKAEVERRRQAAQEEDEWTLTMGWEPIPRNPWVIRLKDGRKLKGFASSEDAQRFLGNEKAVRAVLRLVA
jgi:hypothetical protein